MKKIVLGLAVFFIFLPTISYAFLPLLIAGADFAGAAALRTAISRGAAQLAVSAAERQVLENATKTALNQSVKRLVAMSPNPTRFQLATGAITWAGLGSALLDLGDEIFGVDQSAGVSSGDSADNGRKFYVGAGSGGTKPYFSGDYPESLIYSAYRYQSSNGLLPCNSASGCSYSASFSILSSSTGSSGSTSYQIQYQNSYLTSSGSTATVNRTANYTVLSNANFDSSITPQSADISAEQEETAKNTPLNPQRLADVANALLLDAASQSDYAGIPVSSANPLVTANDFSEALSAVGRTQPTNAEWTTPWEDLETTTDTGTDTGGGTDSGSGSETATEPTLDSPPDGKTILSPLLNIFPADWGNFSVGSRDAVCPVGEFEIWDKNFVIGSHCGLIEQNRELIKIIFLIVWAFSAFRRVMSA
ncbi:hypothetical protein [Klebsiella michiganensis]|uniref:hypothetical protein n=1 Tax=Klebsiella michiganensis TaxID=1134687 RepID=UPI000CDD7BC8|nr:hypothetical protein [Klebsiella michiganensis]EKV4192610.1 hypothetical protein [Klebsiella michiganensis]KAB7488763.1 hypothetical protein F7Q97_25160 [Klebsiella michiganensis]MBG2664325.1 hypothetical protein [Klebsiella michiganensis]MBG2669855.1 hypothetical protein [Klebsiella michiganensis]MBG2675516.1 hypothetical protein [Klebsiella michiganensis]